MMGEDEVLADELELEELVVGSLGSVPVHFLQEVWKFGQ